MGLSRLDSPLGVYAEKTRLLTGLRWMFRGYQISKMRTIHESRCRKGPSLGYHEEVWSFVQDNRDSSIRELSAIDSDARSQS